MNLEQVEEYFGKMYVPLDCQFIVAQPGENGAVTFTEVYHIGKNQRLMTFKLGEWVPKRGSVWTNTTFYTRRGDLQGVSINAAVISDVSMSNLLHSGVFHKKAGKYLTGQEISYLCKFQTLITAFANATGPCLVPVQSSPQLHTFSIVYFTILSFHLRLGLSTRKFHVISRHSFRNILIKFKQANI